MGDRKVTIRDVAAEAGVSIASVSLYLNDRPGLSDTTRERIEDAIQRMHYTPLRRKPEDRSNNVSLIGLLVEKLPVSTFSDMFYGEVIQGLERHARSLGYSIVLMVVDPGKDLSEMITNHANMEGLVLLGGGDITRDTIQQLSDQELPVILVDNQFPDTDLDCVVADNFGGSYQAIQYLIHQGHKRIAFIQGPTKYRSLVDRFRGYCCALIENGLELNFELVQESVSKGIPNKGYREMKALLERGTPFDAVFCVSDRSAFGAMQALQEEGIVIPRDIAIMGFDNVAQSAHTSPPLSTVEVPKSAMGILAMSRLHELINNSGPGMPVKNVLATCVMKRASA